MSAKNNLCVLLSVFLLISAITAKSLSLEDRKKIARQCLKTTGIDRKTVTDIIDAEASPRDGKYGDYLVCTYSIQGFINPSKSVLVPEKIAAFLSDYYSGAEVAFIMDGCKNVSNDVPKLLVLDALDCYTQQFQITNALRETGNEIGGSEKKQGNPFAQV